MREFYGKTLTIDAILIDDNRVTLYKCKGMPRHVPPGFYSQGSIGSCGSDWSTACRSCNGTGVLKN